MVNLFAALEKIFVEAFNAIFRWINIETSYCFGQIGKELHFYKLQPIAKFETIEIQLSVIDSTVSTDRQFLYDIAVAVSSGHCGLAK